MCPQRRQGDLPEGPGAEDDHDTVVGNVGGQGGVDAAGRGFHHDGSGIVHVVGNDVQLRAVGCEGCGPATTGVVAGTGLDAGFQVAEGCVLAVSQPAVGT